MCRAVFNEYRKDLPAWSEEEAGFLETNTAFSFHSTLQGYRSTRLIELPNLAKRLGVASVTVKDESSRFGLNAFKALGASYAVFRFLKEKFENEISPGMRFKPSFFRDPEKLKLLGSMTFCAATDGNHGRAVAWTAKMLGQKAVIYMPSNTAKTRVENIRKEGAKTVLVDGTFDDCVVLAAGDAEKNGWQPIADTGYPGYMEIPKSIILGYTTIFTEIDVQMVHGFDFVFLPAGVGGLAASGCSHFYRRFGKSRPKFAVVEPESSDCFYESVKNGKGEAVETHGKQTSQMVGLNCGMPSLVAWPIVRDLADLFLAIPDSYAYEAMRAYAAEGVESGESGSGALGGLIALSESKDLLNAKKKFGLNQDSRVLVISTEGATDPENYERVMAEK